jgi:PiT family inorganic phosphate transporter
MVVVFTLLVLSVILVNGSTDAPNAISTCITTRSMSPSAAIILAAVCNFAGSAFMALLNTNVACTVYSMVELSSTKEIALASLVAGMSAVVIWAITTWLFGIPTSESHALLAGLSGAVFASSMSIESINLNEWTLVIAGLFLSTLPTLIIARLVYALLLKLFYNCDRRRTIKYFMRTQRLSAAWSAFLHGAQDSQKFMGVFMLGLSITRGELSKESFDIPIYIVLSCSAIMTLGTLVGGRRIIKKVGMDMVELDAVGGTAADMASSAVIFICTLFGIPVSTTHSKASAMMGVGASSKKGANKKIISEMLLAWLLTFPICAAIGFLLFRIITQTL